MNTFSPRDYQLDREYRNRKNEIVHRQTETPARRISRRPNIKTVMTLLFVLMSFIVALAWVPSSQAQTLQEPDGTIGSNVEYALIMGAYYFDKGRFEEAIEQFQMAINDMPEELFQLVPEQAIVFWQLGEALEHAGYLMDALDCYQHYLTLVGEEATDYAIGYVADFESQIEVTNA